MFHAYLKMQIYHFHKKEKSYYPSELLVMPREESISRHTMNRSKAHIPGLEAGTTQMPKDEVADEGGNTEDEINRFTHGPEDTP